MSSSVFLNIDSSLSSSMHMGEPLIHATASNNPVGVGPLAVGNIKYKLQSELLKSMLKNDRKEDKPVYLDFRDAFTVAREIL